MRIIQIQLYVLIWCQAAKTLDHLTDLGQNVTINCTLDASEVYWIIIGSDSPTVILRSFSKSAHYFNKTLKNIYSVQSKHRLVIYNVTVDEIGVYFCMNTDTPPKLSHSTRLNITEPPPTTTTTTPSSENNTAHSHTTVPNPFTNVTGQTLLSHWRTFSLISILLNAVLIITIVGLLKVYVFGNGCWKKYESRSGHHPNTDLQQTQVTEQNQDPNELQYVAVNFSKLRKNIRPSHDNSTYAALNLPRS